MNSTDSLTYRHRLDRHDSQTKAYNSRRVTYTALGQYRRLAGPDGDQLPESRYIQFRVNFNPAGGGQQDISCISEVNLNYEVPLDNST